MKKTWVAVASVVLIVTVAAVNTLGDGENLLNEVFGGTVEHELLKVKSPDGRCVAVLFHKEKTAPGLPPEPSKTLERWARLKVLRSGKTVYDSGYENLNIYQYRAFGALDVMWSPDSQHLAYRHIASFRIIDRDGKATAYPVGSKDSVISSFRWRDNDSLLIVWKTTQYPRDTFGKPENYEGYTGRAKENPHHPLAPEQRQNRALPASFGKADRQKGYRASPASL